ncbi:MAG: IPT/TIG domain-containing protein [Planctomycetota bacterium]
MTTASSCSGLVDAYSANGGVTHTRDPSLPVERRWAYVTGAAGPNHFVTCHEEGWEIVDKAGQVVQSMTQEQFWAPLSWVSLVEQPRVIFDPLSQRFFAMILADRPNLPDLDSSMAFFAVSHSANPTLGWTYYSLDVDPLDQVYPTRGGLGTNDRWLSLTFDLRDNEDKFTHRGSRIYTIDKASLLTQQPPASVTYWHFGASDSREFMPCVTHDAAEPGLYVVNHSRVSATDGRQLLETARIEGPTAAPTLTMLPTDRVPVNYAYFPPDGQQPGNAPFWCEERALAVSPVFRDGYLYLVHVGGLPVSSPNRTALFWYKVDPTLAQNTRIVEDGVVDEGPGTTLFAPSLAVNCAGDVALGFSRSSTTRYIEAAHTLRLAGDSPGSHRPIQTHRAGKATYASPIRDELSTILFCRTSGTSVDPTDDRSFWMVQAYAEEDLGPAPQDDRWGVAWTHLAERSATRLYVKDGAAPGGDGLSWSTALPQLRDAMAIAELPGSPVQEIWVTTGVYFPAVPGSSRSSSFRLRDGLAIYGGFLGYETALDQREPDINVTVLSGDLLGNDSGFFGVSDNSYHVIDADGVGPTAVLDGFTVRSGAATGTGGTDTVGGGLISYNGSPTIVSCRFFRNQAENHGGGAYLQGGSPTFIDCEFDDNRVNYSGGTSAGFGGGVNHSGSPGNHASFVHCEFRDNDAPTQGGGLHLGASATLIGCLFEGNEADYGGALSSTIDSSDAPYLIGCTVAYNTAHITGGGLYGFQSGFGSFFGNRIHDSIFWGNDDSGSIPDASEIYTTCSGSCPSNDIRYSCIQGWPYGGTGNITSNPQFVSSSDLRLQPSSPCIDSGRDSLWPLDLWDLDDDGNSGEAWPLDLGGLARFEDGDGNASVRSDMGAHEYGNVASQPVPPGQTVTLNPGGGSSDPLTQSFADFTNLSTYQTVQATANELLQDPHPGAPGFLVQGGNGLQILTDATDGSYFIRISVAIDAATYGSSPDPDEMDLISFDDQQGFWRLAVDRNLEHSPGHAGPRGDRFVDIGSTPPSLSTELGDYGVYLNPSQQRGFVWANIDHTSDFMIGLRDCDGDGNADATQTDSDGDRLIDGCDQCPQDAQKIEPGPCGCGVAEVDSDQDGTPDCNDLCPGDPNKIDPGDCGCGVTDVDTDVDTDGDGVPDCIDNCVDTPNPDQKDCDGNGVGDACESSPDCNGNGFPDACDILEGRSFDLDNDGFPDECERVIYVDASRGPGGDGASWSTAFTDLQSALAIVLPGDNVWIAAGTYRPGGPGSSRRVRFDLPDGVALYGGFSGGETSLDQRDTKTNVTVLSGDLNGDDAPGFVNRTDNTFQVVVSKDSNLGVRLDGLTIRGGQAEGASSEQVGAGLCHVGGRITVVDCAFRDNWAQVGGGGIYVYRDELLFDGCLFEGNDAGLFGGGAMVYQLTTGSIRRCTFEGNNAGQDGGGLRTTPYLLIEDCAFIANSSGEEGGGMWSDGSSPTLRSCTFLGNSAGTLGGGFSTNNAVTLEDCVFEGNSADSGGATFILGASLLSRVTRCQFRSNTANVSGGGIRSAGALDVRFSDFERNSAAQGGGINAGLRELILDSCRFLQNTATNYGGGLHHGTSSDPNYFAAVNRCTFLGNSAGIRGGGLYLSDTLPGLDPRIVDCLFAGNVAGSEGGAASVVAIQGIAIFTGCTVIANEAGSRAGGIYGASVGTDIRVRNSILWSNVDASGTGSLAQIDGGVFGVAYTCIQDDVPGDGTVPSGSGNIDLDPLVLRAPSHGGDGWGVGDNDDYGNLRLMPTSPCLEQASDSVWGGDTYDLDGDGNVTEQLPYDILGNLRVADGDGDGTDDGDMGAYEQPITAADFDFDMGETTVLAPNGGTLDPLQDAWIEMTNLLGGDDEWVTASESSADLHEGAFGFLPIGAPTLFVETSLQDGDFFLTLRIPFDASALGGADPLAIDLLTFDETLQTWLLAAALNTQNSPGHGGPLGERFAEEGTVLPSLSGALGDYGVFWNPDLQRGFVWANVDHTTDFSPIGRDCNGNGVLDSRDIGEGTSQDCDGNRVPDECQTLAVDTLSLEKGPYAGGQSIRISGSGFSEDATAVDFDGVPAAGVTWISDTEIEVITPAFPKPPAQDSGGGSPRPGHLPSTTVDVTVTTCLDAVTVTDGYTYTARR